MLIDEPPTTEFDEKLPCETDKVRHNTLVDEITCKTNSVSARCQLNGCHLESTHLQALLVLQKIECIQYFHVQVTCQNQPVSHQPRHCHLTFRVKVTVRLSYEVKAYPFSHTTYIKHVWDLRYGRKKEHQTKFSYR